MVWFAKYEYNNILKFYHSRKRQHMNDINNSINSNLLIKIKGG